MEWQGIVLGAVLGFGASIGAEAIRRHWENKAQAKRLRKILYAVADEIEQGVKRCEVIIDTFKSSKENSIKKLSVSRIYTATWDTMLGEVSKGIKDIETLREIPRPPRG